ncbi:MAG: Nif3-like dinuclear metal center hexameric protein [Desulfurobacteriaceae bacterium]
MSLHWKEFEDFIKGLLPPSLALDKDFYGWLGSIRPKKVKKVAVVVDVPISLNSFEDYDVIVSHHLPPFIPQKPVFVVHTPLDRVEWGCNKKLGEKIGLEDLKFLDETRLGMVGSWKKNKKEALENIFKEFNLKFSRFYIPEEEIEKVAVFSGCGLNFVPFIEKVESEGVDLVISGDLTHHIALKLKSKGIGFIEIPHYKCEIPGTMELANRLREKVQAEFVDVGEPYSYFCIS